MNATDLEAIIAEFEAKMARAGVSTVVITVTEDHTAISVGRRPEATSTEDAVCRLIALRFLQILNEAAKDHAPSMPS